MGVAAEERISRHAKDEAKAPKNRGLAHSSPCIIRIEQPLLCFEAASIAFKEICYGGTHHLQDGSGTCPGGGWRDGGDVQGKVGKATAEGGEMR